ncbi:lysoplasmalogenase family protein [Pseudoclavibacter albus]|uniref:lysoplasmalogenase family protein n=1 Tax=Pseudoclavibacter albus TaxID=272241 RepID=UPI000826F079|nr:lysoplasmalogenase family protein [Pseudoclavibacter alba]
MRIAKLIEERLAPFALAGVVLVCVLHVVALVLGWQPLRQTSQSLFIPVLLVWALAPRHQGARNKIAPMQRLSMTVALALCWAADVLPTGMASDAQFFTRAVCFFGSNVAWVLTLWPHRDRSRFVTNRVLMLPYVAAGAIVMSACLPGTESLAGLLPLYVVVVVFMAILSTGLGWPGTLGGLSSLVANAMLGMSMFVLAFDPGDTVRALIVMPTYMLGQTLLVYGLRRAGEVDDTDDPAPHCSPSAGEVPGADDGISRRLPPLPGPEVLGRSQMH